MKTLTTLFWIGWSLGIAPVAAWACRYNVRDVGFVDLDDSNYHLYQVVDEQLADGQQTPPPTESDVHVGSQGESMWTGNIVTRPIDRREAISRGWLEEEAESDASSRAKRILVAPADERRAGAERWLVLVDDPAGDRSTTENRSGNAPGISCCSALSEELIDRLLECHSVILLVEGADPAANAAARESILLAIDETVAGSALWPKPIENPPEIVTISRDERALERVLLWSLETDAQAGEPQVVILFGRGRKLGPVLTVDDVESGKLTRHLGLISIDCECEFDVASLIGPMIPHAWRAAHEARASRNLGFDPGAPLVQVEVHQILSRWPQGGAIAGDKLVPGFGDPTLGYREIELPVVAAEPASGGTESAPEIARVTTADDETDLRGSADPQIESVRDANPAAPTPLVGAPSRVVPSTGSPSTGSPSTGTSSSGARTALASDGDTSTQTPWQVVWWALAGVLVVSLVGSGLIIWQRIS